MNEKTTEYIETMADYVGAGIEQVEGTFERDIEAAKEVKEELEENYRSLKED